jgi:NAD(P)-dependent dehydrogenase (short-subunit alcohol dehydrogenase family)
MTDHSGRVVLVTGGASGIGEAVVRRFAGRGASVVVADIRASDREQVVGSLDGDHWGVHLDVTDPDGWKELAAQIAERYGRLDVAHLNAGVMSRPRGQAMFDDPLAWLEPAHVQPVIDVNIGGVVHGIAALMGIVERAGGCIIATGSNGGLEPLAADPAYAMSKHAVVGLVESLAPALWQRGVRLMTVCPSGISTPMVPEDYLADRVRTGRPMQSPDYIAGAVEAMAQTGKPGEIWIARQQDHGFWIYDKRPLPQAPPGAVIPYEPTLPA